jgi:hypothetical protein
MTVDVEEALPLAARDHGGLAHHYKRRCKPSRHPPDVQHMRLATMDGEC